MPPCVFFTTLVAAKGRGATRNPLVFFFHNNGYNKRKKGSAIPPLAFFS
jgi:hypothetical protein